MILASAWHRLRGRLLRRQAHAVMARSLASYRAGDLATAATLALQAARMDHPEAQSILASLLDAGQGLPPNPAEAARWLKRAADLGHPQAMCELGQKHASGSGLPADPALAAHWWRRAAEAGDATGQMLVARAYQEGRGVPVDLPRAVDWLRQAAQQREPTACHLLGIALENGEGVAQDLEEAFVWQRRAAEGGLVQGKYNVARLYAHGIGVRVDKQAAALWLARAAQAAGVEPVPVPERPEVDDDPPSDFNRRICFFAFHLVPAWLRTACAAAEPMARGVVEAEVERLWDEAGRLAVALGGVVVPSAPRPRCEEHRGIHGPWWSVHVPLAIKPPEPSLLVIGLGGDLSVLHLAEIWAWPMRPLAWCRIDGEGRHALLGRLELPRREQVLASLVDHGEPGLSATLPPDAVLQLLSLYAEAAHDFERAQGLATV